jgi:hypothetical protein
MRKVDTADTVRSWLSVGCKPSEAAIEFAMEFDGITFEYPRHASVGGLDVCYLDGARATRAVHESRIREYEVRVNESLCPIGRAASNHQALVMAPSGKVYGGYDSNLVLLGNSGREAIWRIFGRREPLCHVPRIGELPS